MEHNELKNTGVIWIPKIPKHWDLIKVRHLFKESTTKGFPDEPLLVASQEYGVVNKDVFGKRTMEATKDFHLLKLVEKGDFVISLRSFQGGIELSHQRGIISPAYTILKEQQTINKRYYKHLFKSKPFISLMTLCVKGIRDGQNIDFPTFKNEYLPLPPIDEQERIGAYLDRKTRQIQEFISRKERLVEVLEEKKISIISQELNYCKDELKLKYLLRIQNGDGIASDLIHNEGLYEVYGGNGVLGYYSKFNNSNETIIVGRVGALCGNVHYSNSDIWVNDNAMFVKTKHYYKYIFYLLKDANLNSLSFANAQPLITGTLIKNQTVKFENDFDKQISIVAIIEKRLKAIEDAICKARTEIEKAKEYQESLITQVVTGQLRVPCDPDVTERENKLAKAL